MVKLNVREQVTHDKELNQAVAKNYYPQLVRNSMRVINEEGCTPSDYLEFFYNNVVDIKEDFKTRTWATIGDFIGFMKKPSDNPIILKQQVIDEYINPVRAINNSKPEFTVDVSQQRLNKLVHKQEARIDTALKIKEAIDMLDSVIKQYKSDDKKIATLNKLKGELTDMGYNLAKNFHVTQFKQEAYDTFKIQMNSLSEKVSAAYKEFKGGNTFLNSIKSALSFLPFKAFKEAKIAQKINSIQNKLLATASKANNGNLLNSSSSKDEMFNDTHTSKTPGYKK